MEWHRKQLAQNRTRKCILGLRLHLIAWTSLSYQGPSLPGLQEDG